MHWIEALDLENWGKRIDAKSQLPFLVCRLIHASVPNAKLRMPKGRDIYGGGWDGVVFNPDADTSFVPAGNSFWELGARLDVTAKLDEDYSGRSAQETAVPKSDAAIILVTPFKCSSKDSWVAAKKAENIWKDVIVYDCVDLEEWLLQNVAVARWFSIEIRKYPHDGIQSTDHCWEEYQVGGIITLTPEIVTSNRRYQIEQLASFLKGNFALKAVQASTKEEAIAFIVAAAMQFSDEDSGRFFSRSLVINTEDNFRSIANNQSGLILIARFENPSPLYYGVSKGHHVLVPLGADDTLDSVENVNLPNLGHELEDCLIKAGLERDEARNLAHDSGLNLTILRRRLKFPSIVKAKWAMPEHIGLLLPALFLGKWDESCEGDKALLSELSGITYEDYVSKISQWKNESLPFIYKIGTKWRLASALDAWDMISHHISPQWLQKFGRIAPEIIGEVKPRFQLESEVRYMAGILGKTTRYSGWAKEGATQSLILIAMYGERFDLPLGLNSQLWVDNIVTDLLKSDEKDQWKSLGDVFTLLAEASPKGFMKSIKMALASSDKAILSIFEEEAGGIFPTSYHSGMLWALEGLAWFEDFFDEAISLLAELAAHDPGGRLSNRPQNSLRDIFLPWMPQTFASLVTRKRTLLKLSQSHPQVAWQLLVAMLPENHAIATPSHKTRWRHFGANKAAQQYNPEEAYQCQEIAVELLLLLAGIDEERLAAVIDKVDNLESELFDRVVDHINKRAGEIPQKSFAIWHSLRKTLNHHKSFPDQDWSMSTDQIATLQELYELLEPVDVIDKYLWLFNDNYPQIVTVDPEIEFNFDRKDQQIFAIRKHAFEQLYKACSFDQLLHFSDTVTEKYIFGRISALYFTAEEIGLVINDQKLSDTFPNYYLAGLVFEKAISSPNNDWVFDTYRKLADISYSGPSLASFLAYAPFNERLVDFVEDQSDEIKRDFWLKVNPYMSILPERKKIAVISNLLSVDRQATAIREVALHIEEFPTSTLVDVLDYQKKTQIAEQVKVGNYEVERIFQQLYLRNDFDESKVGMLEWKYIQALGHYHGKSGNTKFLQQELSSNPAFFIDVLKLLYRAKDDDENADVELSEEEKSIKHALANNAYSLFSNWRKIPGVTENGEIDEVALLAWVHVARQKADEEKRLEAADMQIGKLLATYPETADTPWPPSIICEILDTTNSDSMLDGFRVEIFNKRGSSSRGPYDGGERERRLAALFNGYAQQWKNRWPITSSLLHQLAEGYLRDAKRQDDEAELNKLEY